MQYSNPNSAVFGDILPNIKRVLDAAHAGRRPVLYGQHTAMPSEFQTKYSTWLAKQYNIAGRFVNGSPGWKIVKEVAPKKSDFVIKKYSPNFFWGTNLEDLLRRKGVETLVFVGVSTEHGVDTTARQASFMGIMPVIVEDAVSSGRPWLQEPAIKVMREAYCFEFQKTDYVVKKLKER
jgi:nicotinamidase-related amidase